MEDTAEPIVPDSQPEPTIPRSNDLTGRTLGGDFFLERRIGQGGMGQVYLAKQLSLKRQVAVKILRTDLAANVTALQRFHLEAEAVARITHANIVQVYAIGEENGLHFMALEYVEGRNLRDYLAKKGPPELPIAINLLRQIAAALHRAHELGFVHRDIKPENILLTRKGEVKVTDFGLSRCFVSEQPLHITQSGVTMGTPLYMSPEQVQGHTVDPRSDIYSFGVTAYHLLAGEPPFKGNTPFEVAIQHVQNEPRRLEEFGIPHDLAAIVHKMMAKKPAERYPSSREVLRELTRYRESVALTQAAGLGTGGMPYVPPSPTGPAVPLANGTMAATPIPRHRPYLWIIGLLLLAGAGVAGAFLHQHLFPPNVGDEVTAQQGPLPSVLDAEANAIRAREKELLKRLDDKSSKPDVLIESLLELTQLYLRERRFDDATRLFEKDLNERAGLKELVRGPFSVVQPQVSQLLSKLGMGIVFAHRDMAKESLENFAVVIPKGGAPKDKRPLIPRPVDLFLRKYPDWSRAVADALDRDAKNLGGKLDEPFARYRTYSKPDR